MRSRRHLLGLISATTAGALGAACGAPSSSPDAPADTPAPGGSGATAGRGPVVPSMRLAVLANEETLQPYTYQTGYPGLNLLLLVYDTVMQLDAENVPKPLLAR